MSMMRKRRHHRNRRSESGLSSWNIGGHTNSATSQETGEIVIDAQRTTAQDAARISKALTDA